MTKKTVSFLLLCTLFFNYVHAQAVPQKRLQAQRTTASIKIDGNLDEAVWKNAVEVDSFIEMRPAPGATEKYITRTQVYILYDNTSIYVGGYCHEPSSDSVSRELAGRDKVGSNDFVGVIFDTYNDKINAFGFYVTPLGEQYDAKYSNTNGEDATWDAVWYSEAKIVKDGWTFEMRIPYSALRFSSKGRDWGLNITRRRNKTGQQFMWNPVLPTVNGFVNQEGLWTGVTNIKPPVRLSFSPYFSAYVNHYQANNNRVKDFNQSVNGGMDVKYGINQSYTLDMTLIPDFGQVQSDKVVLNLTPFETKYAENRPFFTEGTELFNKGGLFYSRRIGGSPIHKYDIYNSLDPNDLVVDNPSESKLLNATKISGRNQKGLGIGFLNAVAKPMYAEVEDTATNQVREVQTSTLTNYNIIVVDQTLKHNSSVSLINTNVWRSGPDYDANVTAAVMDINNKKNTYEWYAKASVSNLMGQGNTSTGFAHTESVTKTGGRFNFTINQDIANVRYDINDLGLLYNNDYMNHYLWFGYKWVKPHNWYNNMYFNINNNLSHRFSDGAFESFNFNTNLNGQLKSLWYVGASLFYNAPGHDFYEPRESGRVFNTPKSAGTEMWFNTNSSKKYYFSMDGNVAFKDLFNGKAYFLSFENRYRFNNKLSVTHDMTLMPSTNDVGFADIDTLTHNIIFSRRKINTVENILSIKYNFTKNSGITFVARHYWREVIPLQLFTLNDNGDLSENNLYQKDLNQNYNTFTIDMVYTWQFGPGSFLNIVWKNATDGSDYPVDRGYSKNFTNTLGSRQNNNLSVKIIYYLDYLRLKRRK